MTEASEMVERVSKALAERNYPSASPADIADMAEGFRLDAIAALAAIEAAGYVVVRRDDMVEVERLDMTKPIAKSASPSCAQ